MAAEKTLKFLLFGEDRSASRTLKGVGDEIDRQAKRWDTLANVSLAAAAAMTAAVGKFAYDSVRAYAEADKAHRVLEDAYARFPAIASVSISAMEDQAAAIQKVTGADGDAINAAQGLMAQYELTGEQIADLTPLLVDFAVKTGRDVPAAAEVLGKAMTGQGRALKEVGIDFEDTGSVAGNYAQVMEGLRTQVGGFAEQEGKTAEGQLRILKEQFGDLQEQVGAQLTPALTDLIGVLSNVVTFVGENAVAVEVFAGAAITLTAGVGGTIKAMQAWKTITDTLKVSTATLATSVGVLTAGIGLLAIGVGTYANAQREAKARMDDLAATLDAQTGAITDNTSAWVENELTKDQSFGINNTQSMIDAAEELGISIETVTRAYLGQPDAIRDAKAAAEEYLSQQNIINDTSLAHSSLAQRFIRNIDDQSARLEAAGEIARTKAEVDAEAAKAQGVLGDAYGDTTDAMGEQKTAAELLQEALDKLNGVNQSAEQAEINWAKQLAETSKTLDENTKTLDINSEAGRNNRQTLLDMASQAYDLASARLAQTGSEELFRDTINQGRDALYAQARQFFATDEEAWAYVNTLLAVPKNVNTEVTADTRAAEAALAYLTRPRFVAVGVRISGSSLSTIMQADGGLVDYFAGGGFRERHVAQIAPAGAMRVWAEPETGGEAYIPLAASKRERSLDIWWETGRRLGAVSYADGGLYGGGAGGGLSRADLDYLADRIGSTVLAGAREVSIRTTAGALSTQASRYRAGVR